MQAKDFKARAPGHTVPTIFNSLAFVPNPLPPKVVCDKVLRKADESALLALGELRAIIPSLPNPDLITQPFLRREAVLSSKIEGTDTELEGLYMFEAQRANKPPADTDSHEIQDQREVANYVIALEYGIEQIKKIPICNRLMKEMHLRLLAGAHRDRGRYKSPGDFRSSQAYIGGADISTARYVAPPNDHIESLMRDLEQFIHASNELPTLVRISLIHYQFEAIHPFADGNGRIGRLLILLLMISYEILPGPLLYLSAYFNRNKDQYVKRLWETSRRGAWKDWILFFLRGIEEEAKDACARSRRILTLREKYRSELQQEGCSGALLSLLDHLFQWPVISVPVAKSLLGMTFQGAKNNLERLVEKKILDGATGGRRMRFYLARPIIDVLS